VIVCHCEAVNDRAVAAAALAGARDLEAIAAACRAGTDCGGCHRMLERLLAEHAPAVPDRAVA
jgi:bacterioferritin-associated ferredoxin